MPLVFVLGLLPAKEKQALIIPGSLLPPASWLAVSASCVQRPEA